MKFLKNLNIPIYGTRGTADFYSENGFEIEKVFRPHKEIEPNIQTYLEEGKIDLVINIPKNNEKSELDSDYFIRRKAIDLNIPLITNIQVAKRFVKSIYYSNDKLLIKSWSDYK
jgi:carbamoyl-phosphate synthase large subunit